MLIPTTDTSLSNSDSGKVMEGSVLVNILKPEKCCTFKDYAANIIVPKISKEVHLTSRVDIVFDTYLENSLKDATRNKRGKGLRRKVQDDSETPSNWPAFLRINENKQELFPFLSKYIVQLVNTAKPIVTAFDNDVLAKNITTLDLLTPCNHEEADTRVFLHAKHV